MHELDLKVHKLLNEMKYTFRDDDAFTENLSGVL